ncbi:MAG: hypothetical protein J6X53_07170, partial [Abditibacteriota bacterium]|nr:hypothetical protein [Abditibacteriota bacterium]
AYRGDILITSSAKRVRGCVCGYALCVARLVDVVPFERKHIKPACLDGMPDPIGYAWILDNIRMIQPVAVKGKLNLWNCDDIPLDFWPMDCTEAEAEKLLKEKYDPLIYAPKH